MTRRLLFAGGALALLQSACSKSGFKGQAQVGELAVETETTTVATGDLPTEASALNLCQAVDNPQINTQKISNAEKIPQTKFYGRTDSALMAILLPEGEDIRQIILATEAGKLMALHGITGADKKPNGSWRPIVVDSLYLVDKGTALTNITVLMQYADRITKATIGIAYFNKYEDKPVVDLSSRQVPAEFLGRQSVAQFSEVAGSFSVDTKAIYPNIYNAGTVRNLQTAKSESSWAVGAGVLGTVTDIMGNPIDLSGSNLLEYHVFCTYVATETGWARTMIQIG